MKKLTLEEMKNIAGIKGGGCLSDKYIDANTKLKWQCKEGHIWEARPHDIQRNHWCPYCFGNAKLTLNKMQSVAKKHGGICLSNKYLKSNIKLIWQCSKGHIWKSTPNNIQRGEWCPYCAGNIRLTIEDMQQTALERGGWCLSLQYINNHTKLWWQCGEGHVWDTKPSNIKNKRWCPYCYGNKKLSIEEAKKEAKKHGGMCLSTKYINARTKLIWRCNKYHIWESTYDSIRHGSWCPICLSSSGENICRVYFEIIFDKKFFSKRPEWLINSHGYKMELDGYNEELSIAFEYNGEYHYKCPKNYDKDFFEYQRQKDEIKKELCKKHNVKLIVVPYTIEFEDMQNYIIEECMKEGIKI